jgi:uncharacterized protein YegL
MEQFNFDNNLLDAVPQIVNASEHHMALLFLVDTSGSMGAKIIGKRVSPIDELNTALNRFKAEVCMDEHTKDILDVAIVEFNTEYRVVQEFSPIEYMKPVELQASGVTYINEALGTAINMVTERSRFYRRTGAEPYKPWIVLISDGAPMDTSIDEMANRINELVEQERLAFWSLAVEGANIDVLHKLSGRRVLKLAGYDFSGFLDWANKSMRAVSQSSPGEKIKGQALPTSVTIDDLM